ncbi:MAG: NUDIX domain-containing protein [Frankiaceae bacterium]
MDGLTSAGLLLFRVRPRGLEVLLAHIGGPYWARKDNGAWTIPKGECGPGEDYQAAALREFEEELGHPAPMTEMIPLGSVKQAGGKTVVIWAAEGDFDPSTAVSNLFEMEWPPGSGRIQAFPEVDRADWFDLQMARDKLLRAQGAFLDRLVAAVAAGA